MHSSKKVLEGLSGDLRRIADVAGVEAAIKIGREFRGMYLYIRGVDALRRLVRDTEIRREHGEGMSIRKLSRRHGLSQRQIRNILCAADEDLPEPIQRIIGGGAETPS